jgi:glutamate-1-semialdehyde 2,1-aminomutase
MFEHQPEPPTLITDTAIDAMLRREDALYRQRNPKSAARAEAGGRHWLNGVPMLWMSDWGTPFPLIMDKAEGATLTDIDGNTYADFCLGDTGAMFGHTPEPVVKAIAAQAARGTTTMLPSSDAAIVGELLADGFGLPYWQVTATASDANRAILRWCRAVTGRSRVLVFNRCYHGAVEDTFVTLKDGKVITSPSLVGEVRDLPLHTRMVEFNDLSALEQALADETVACVLAEPVMTNVGMVLPDPGYHDALRELTRRTGTLLVIDETHCLSSGPGGYTRAEGLDPDAIVLGKPVAGGVPTGIYGVSEEFGQRVRDYLGRRDQLGFSGIGTTLSGSALQMAAMRAVLENYFTEGSFAPVIELAKQLEAGIATLIGKHGAPWHVVRVGARVEFMCAPERPRNGGEAYDMIHKPVDVAVHHYLLNRGVLITPFHNMMLICPATTQADVNALLEGLDSCLAELGSAA